MKKVVFEDEITLYWDKEWDCTEKICYALYKNGERVGETNTTHYTFNELSPNTVYEIAVERRVGNVSEIVYKEEIETPCRKRRIDVTLSPYFAVGDGKTLNTKALQRAINDCGLNDCVYLPEGVFLTGALELHSDMEIYVEKSATLQGSANVNDYTPKIRSRFEGIEMDCYRPLLNLGKMDKNGGYVCENVVLRGGGEIRGGGKDLAWAVIDFEKELMKKYLEDNAEYVKTCENGNTIPGRPRPRLILMSNSQNITICNLAIGFGPAWNVHFIYSKNILTYNCQINSVGVWNGDGWDPDSSEDCTIFNVAFGTHDDAIAIKSGKNPEGNIINRPTKNIKIFDCRGSHGIAVGSELSGGIEGVFIWDCDMRDANTLAGFRVKTTRKRGGYVRNVKIKDCRLEDIRIWSGYKCNDDGESSGDLTVLENFYFENITIKGGFYHEKYDNSIFRFDPLMLMGFDEQPIRNVLLKNIKLLPFADGTPQQFQIQNVENLSIENLCQSSGEEI